MPLGLRDVVSEAAAAGMARDVLAVIGRWLNADGAILWYYDSSARRFIHLEDWRVEGGRKFSVPSTPEPDPGQDVRGIISLIRPEIPFVAYDQKDHHLWVPKRRPGTWRPRDEGVFGANKWRSCLAFPIVSDGYLVGCVSCYSPRSVTNMLERFNRYPSGLVDSALQGLLRVHEESSRIARIEQAFDDQLARELSSAAVLGVVHDISSDIRRLGSLLKDAIPLKLRAIGAEEALSLEIDEGIVISDRLLKMVQHMKIISRDRPAGRTRVDVSEVVRDLEPLLHSQVKQRSERKSELKMVIAPSSRGYSYDVSADPVKLERAIVNLVENAAFWSSQSSASGSVTIRVSPASIDEQGASGVNVAVSDNGPGISPTDRPHIFRTTLHHTEGVRNRTRIVLSETLRKRSWRGNTRRVPTGSTTFSVVLPPYER